MMITIAIPMIIPLMRSRFFFCFFFATQKRCWSRTSSQCQTPSSLPLNEQTPSRQLQQNTECVPVRITHRAKPLSRWDLRHVRRWSVFWVVEVVSTTNVPPVVDYIFWVFFSNFFGTFWELGIGFFYDNFVLGGPGCYGSYFWVFFNFSKVFFGAPYAMR